MALGRRTVLTRRRLLELSGGLAGGGLLGGCTGGPAAFDAAKIGDRPLKERTDAVVVGTHIDREFMFHRPYRDTLLRDFELIIIAAPVFWGASNGGAAAAITRRPTASAISPTRTGSCCADSR